MSNAAVTPTPLCVGDMGSKTISNFLQFVFTAGTYIAGGLPSGVQAFADGMTIDVTQFLWSDVHGEDQVTTSPAVGGYSYKYAANTDTLQVFLNSTEITGALPAAVLNDLVIGVFTYNRL